MYSNRRVCEQNLKCLSDDDDGMLVVPVCTVILETASLQTFLCQVHPDIRGEWERVNAKHCSDGYNEYLL